MQHGWQVVRLSQGSAANGVPVPPLWQAIFAKARKLPKQSPELRADLEAFEARLDADAAEVAEEEAAATAAAAAAQAEAAAPPGPRPAAAAAGEGEAGDGEEAAIEDNDETEATAAHSAGEGEPLRQWDSDTRMQRNLGVPASSCSAK